LQDEIVQKIVTALRVKLTAEEQERFLRAPTTNLEAYDWYLRGVEYIEHSTYGSNMQVLQDMNAQARQMFEKATELDPQYAAAYARLGQTYLWDWFYHGEANPQPLEQAFGLAQKAAALTDSLPIAHIILGQVYIWRRQPELALTHGYRARALAPNDPDIAVGMAGILNAVKGARGGEAIGLVEMAMRLNPHYPERYLFVLGEASRWIRSEEAIAAYKRVLAHNPTTLVAQLLLIRTYVEAGREEEARAEAAEVLKRDPHFSLESIRQKVAIAALNQQAFEEFLKILPKAGLK
jgi:adenylate cyclase